MDLEALEAENDRGIAALSERVGALRGVTSGIHGEVESQHRLLDSMVRCGQHNHMRSCGLVLPHAAAAAMLHCCGSGYLRMPED